MPVKREWQRLSLQGPAGSGKTHVGLNVMLSTLRTDEQTRVLFVAKTEALALFVVGWLCVRLLGSADVSLSPAMAALLERLEVVYPKKGESMPSVHRRYSCSDGRLWPSPPEVRSGSEQYDLVIVDESHHVYADSTTRQEIEQRFVSSAARECCCSQTDHKALL